MDTLYILIDNALAYAPDWSLPISLALATIAAALTVHGIAISLAARWFAKTRPYLLSVFTNTRGITRLAIIVCVCALLAPTAPLSPSTQDAYSHVLGVAFIVLAGWIAMISTRAASNLYLRRFELGSVDNLLARKHITQFRILRGAADTLIVVVTVAAAFMTFDAIRQYGVSLFASAGVAGIVAALAARPVLANLFAGIQIAMTQPIRMGDAVLVEGEWGWIEEITMTYVVVKVWDWRRLIVPLAYFIERPFQNWTRDDASLIGTVMIYTDYSVPVERMRQRLTEILSASPLWDKRINNLQVSEANERTIQLRALVSAKTSPEAWDLRCEVREKLIAFLQKELPTALPKTRTEVENNEPVGLLATSAGAPGLPR